MVALAVFALALTAFGLLRARSEHRYAVSSGEAVKITLADPRVKEGLGDAGYTQARVSPLDAEQQRVSLFRGQRLVVLALVGPDRSVTRVGPGASITGNEMVSRPPLLIGLTVLFLLVTATVPLLSLRNLDVIGLASFAYVCSLISHGFVNASMLIAYPALGYLVARFLWIGLSAGGGAPAVSLCWRLTSGWSAAERRRTLTAVAVGLAAVVAMLTLSSGGTSDVAFASLAGATDLLDGTVPYGHTPGFIVHGDTYPPLTYLAYVPAAALTPVRDAFSDPEGALALAAIATLLTAAGLYRLVAWDHGRSSADSASADREPLGMTGLRAAIAWLAYPPVLLAASSGFNDLVLALCLVAVLLSVSRPRRSAVLLGVAAWVKLSPVFALPIWLARMRGRQLVESAAMLATLSAAIVGGLVVLGGAGSVSAMIDALAFQFERVSLFSIWTGLGIGPLQPAAQALLIATIAIATLAVHRDPVLGNDPLRLAALLAGVLLMSQFAANYWTWSYLPWALVPALAVLAPAESGRETSAEAAPATIEPAAIQATA